MTIAFGITAIVGYLIATGLLGLRLTDREGDEGLTSKSAIAAITLAALICHGVALYRGVSAEGGLNLDLFNSASLVAWVVVALAWIAASSRPLDSVYILVLPVAAASVALSLAFGGMRLLTAGSGPGVEAHIISSILAYSLFALGAVQAVLLAYQDHRLRHKRFGGILRIMPPLATQEALMFQLLGAGFFLLSLSLMSGIMFLGDDIFAQHLVHKTVLSTLSWLVFAALLFGRWRYGWRGRTAVKLYLSGFIILVLAYFGTRVVLELLLGSSWNAQ